MLIKNNPVITVNPNLRNPIINVSNNIKVQTIGDVHLGKTFKTGVSSSKLGVRESLIVKDLSDLMFPPADSPITHVVIVGDLFDKYIVSPNIVMIAYDLLMKASDKYSHIEYFLIPGNHDFSRDITKKSSYSLLYLMLQGLPNIHIVYDKFIYHEVDEDNALYFDSYDAFHKEREESYYNYPFKKDTNIISFGHWDSIKNEFGSYYPHKDIVEYSSTIVSGHIHTPEQFESEGVQYIYTGSLQPYSHAEDPHNQFYITIQYDVLESYFEKESTTELEKLSTKNVRISCYPGYVLPFELECLSLTYYNNLVHEIEASESEETSKTITDFSSLYLHVLKEDHDVEKDLLIKINDFLKDTSDNVQFSLD